MNLVVDQVVQLEQIFHSDRHRPRELLAGSAVEQDRLTRLVESRPCQSVVDVRFLGTVEHRRRDRNAGGDVSSQRGFFAVGQRFDFLFVGLIAVGIPQSFLQLLGVAGPFELLDGEIHRLSEPSGRPAHVGFEYLADVHPRRHAERIEHDVDRHPVLQKRHVLHRDDF